MKSSLFILAILISLCSFGNKLPRATDTVVSKVYVLANSKAISAGKEVSDKNIFSGSGAVLSSHIMNLVTLQKKGMMNYASSTSMERFFIVKKGPVQVTLKDKTATLDRGSVICLLPGDVLRIANATDEPAEYYEMIYQSKTPVNMERAKKAGESFTMDWKDMVFKPHDKGGVRQLFDRQTAMLNRFDIHVTQLNEGFNSHPPHTHKNEEIILMLEGNAEMQIGAEHQKANPGDVVMLSSNIPHNLTNIGKTACLYFAIQWN